MIWNTKGGHAARRERLLKILGIFCIAAVVACGGSRPGGQTSGDRDSSSWGPVFPETCTAKGEEIRIETLAALDRAVETALADALNAGGICVPSAPPKDDTAGASPMQPFEEACGEDAASKRVQAAGAAVFDGRFLDMTASSYPHEVLRIGNLLLDPPTVTRISLEEPATALLQMGRHLSVISRTAEPFLMGHEKKTQVSFLEDATPALRVTRTVTLSGEPVSAFRIGTVAYLIMRQAAFGIPADPTVWVPPEINCKTVSSDTIRASFEALRRRMADRIAATPITLAPAVSDSAFGSAVSDDPSVADCGAASKSGAALYVAALTEDAGTPATVQIIDENSLVTNADVGLLYAAFSGNGEHAMVSLSGTSITSHGTFQIEGTVPGDFAVDRRQDTLRVFSVSGPEGRSTRLTSFVAKNGTMALLGTAMPEAAVPDNACAIQLLGRRREVPAGVRAAAFSKDRAYAASCRGIEIWTAGSEPPRFLTAFENDSAIVYLRLIDERTLLCIGYTLDAGGRAQAVFLRLTDVGNPLRPKVVRTTVVADAEQLPDLDARAIRVLGNTLALPLVFERGSTSGAVYVYQFDAASGFALTARIPFGAPRISGGTADGDRVFLKGDRVFTVTEHYLQINRTGNPEKVVFSISR